MTVKDCYVKYQRVNSDLKSYQCMEIYQSVRVIKDTHPSLCLCVDTVTTRE